MFVSRQIDGSSVRPHPCKVNYSNEFNSVRTVPRILCVDTFGTGLAMVVRGVMVDGGEKSRSVLNKSNNSFISCQKFQGLPLTLSSPFIKHVASSAEENTESLRLPYLWSCPKSLTLLTFLLLSTRFHQAFSQLSIIYTSCRLSQFQCW